MIGKPYDRELRSLYRMTDDKPPHPLERTVSQPGGGGAGLLPAGAGRRMRSSADPTARLAFGRQHPHFHVPANIHVTDQTSSVPARLARPPPSTSALSSTSSLSSSSALPSAASVTLMPGYAVPSACPPQRRLKVPGRVPGADGQSSHQRLFERPLPPVSHLLARRQRLQDAERRGRDADLITGALLAPISQHPSLSSAAPQPPPLDT